MRKARTVYLDLTHLGRHVTGLERIAIELFEKATFENADIRPVRAGGLVSMIFKQQIWLPVLAMMHPRAAFLFPGFPPSPLFVFWRRRTLLYVHDLFLITRKQDLSLKAKLYMAWPFALAVRRLKYFLANSKATAEELAAYTRADAGIALYRPPVRNVFQLDVGDRATRPQSPHPLKLVALGTVEPRKNYGLAAEVRQRLQDRLKRQVELHIIGRGGWGADGERLGKEAGILIHGYLDAPAVKGVLEDCDIYLCTSHDEGLGLPLLEAQYAGLAMIAPDKPVFLEVLGTSGRYFSAGSAEDAVAMIVQLLERADWRRETAKAAVANVGRWNETATGDRRLAEKIFCGTSPGLKLAPTALEKV